MSDIPTESESDKVEELRKRFSIPDDILVMIYGKESEGMSTFHHTSLAKSMGESQ